MLSGLNPFMDSDTALMISLRVIFIVLFSLIMYFVPVSPATKLQAIHKYANTGKLLPVSCISFLFNSIKLIENSVERFRPNGYFVVKSLLCERGVKH